MKRLAKLFPLNLMVVFCTSCEGQNKTDRPKENSKPGTKGTVTSPGSNDPDFNPKYEYTDSVGKRLIIANCLPRGEKYTDPNGKEYFKSIFWTRITNETVNPLELNIDFPVDLYEVPSLPGKYRKVLVPPDTMTPGKLPLFNYDLTDLISFLDSSIHKPSSIKRTIHPKESSGFFVVLLSPKNKKFSWKGFP
jgi:hypothetical protein